MDREQIGRLAGARARFWASVGRPDGGRDTFVWRALWQEGWADGEPSQRWVCLVLADGSWTSRAVEVERLELNAAVLEAPAPCAGLGTLLRHPVGSEAFAEGLEWLRAAPLELEFEYRPLKGGEAEVRRGPVVGTRWCADRTVAVVVPDDARGGAIRSFKWERVGDFAIRKCRGRSVGDAGEAGDGQRG